MKVRPFALGLVLSTLIVPMLVAIEGPVVVSAFQGHCREGDFTENVATIREAVQSARDRGSQFLALPECFLSGYESREVVQRGARSLDDPELRAFIEESKVHGMVILAGLARRSGTNHFNSVLVIHRGRLLGWYDKVLLTQSDRERLGFTAGTQVPVFEAHGVRFAVLISAETAYPHFGLTAQLQDAQLLFAPHYDEIRQEMADDHRRWARHCHVGLACQLKAVVVRANVVKSERPGQIGYGDSFILGPQGETLAEARLFKAEVITATLDPAMFRLPSVWANLDEVPGTTRLQLAHLLSSFRPPTDDADLKSWLENMVRFHHFDLHEVSAATGLTPGEINEASQRFGIDLQATAPQPGTAHEPIRVMPYPGGRHPRRGFFEGAVAPQRETKVSIFTPWSEGGYVVADVPEAIFSNLGLTYLAHTHIPTIWDRAGVVLPRQEWNRTADGLVAERVLPNGIAFGTRVTPGLDGVRFELWLRNGTANALSGLRVQNCVMLGAARGFATQTMTNKLFVAPFAAARSVDGPRWVITAWEHCGRAWGNELVPCIHADPVFPNCMPGETQRLKGWLSFYEGDEIRSEIERLTKLEVIRNP